jgi:VWFA-related protein
MHRLSTLVAVVLVTAATLTAQTAQAPVFRAGTTLVRVDVTVLDAAGKPVPGLAPDDFEITLDGSVQRVQTVDYQVAPTKRAAAATSERQATNATRVPDPRLVVMLVDDLSIPATGNRDLFHAASRFVVSLPEADFVGLATTSGEASVNPTRDHLAVAVGLRRAVGRLTDLRSLPPAVVVGVSEAIEIAGGNQSAFFTVVSRECLNGRAPSVRDLEGPCANDIERKARGMAQVAQRTADVQLASYQAVINAMRPVAGEKALVILSEGLIVTARGQRPAVDITDLERDAAIAGVQLSILYPGPEGVSMTARTPAEATVAREDGQALRLGLENIAGATGGNFYNVAGQPDRFFGFVATAMSAVYHLGVEAPAGSAPGREFKLSARVKRAGVTVRANRLAMQDAVAAPVSVDAQLESVANKGELKYGVPIAVGAVIRPGKTAEEIALGVNIEVPAGVPGPLRVQFAAVDEKGKSRTGKHTLSAPGSGGGYRLSFSVPVPPGSYRLRVGIADADGQVGSIDLPVAAQLSRVGPFRMSDILSAWIGADGRPQFLSLGNVPPVATSLVAGVELVFAQEAAPPTGVRVTWAIVTESGQPVAQQTVDAVPAGNRLNAQTQVSVSSLPAGTYELRATVLIANQAAGGTSVSFRKSDKLACACGIPLRGLIPVDSR